MGDVNINLLNSDSHLQTAEFLETLYSFSFSPLITKPTRNTDNTATLIDNIFTNYSPNKKGVAGILCTDITDHLPIYYIDQEVKVIDMSEKIPLLQRQYSTKNKIRFFLIQLCSMKILIYKKNGLKTPLRKNSLTVKILKREV